MSDATPADSGPSLDAKVAKGAAWIAGGGILLRIVGFVNTLVLVRLLIPEDFGLVALGMTIMQLLQNVSDVGVSQAVVRYRDETSKTLDTLFTFSVLRGLLVMTIMCASAPWAGDFFGDPRVTQILLAMGGIAMVQSLINPRFYEFERDMDFSKEFLVGLITKGLSVVVSVSVAVMYQSYWALVLGVFAGVGSHTALSYFFRPYRPRFSFAAFHKLIGFTGWLTGVSFIVALNNKLEPLILGRILGAAPTGIFHMGTQLSTLPSMELATPVARAIYPGLTSIQDDPGAMRTAFLRGAAALGAVAVPAGVGWGFVAQDFVAGILGPQWTEAVPILQLLGPIYGFLAIYYSTQGYAMARGMTKLVFYREVMAFLISKPIFIWAAMTHGLEGAIIAAGVNGGIFWLFQARLYAQISGGHIFEPFWAARRSILAVVGMAAYFWGVRPFLPWLEDWPALARLGWDVMWGGVGYMSVLVGVWLASGRPDGVEATVLRVLGRAR